MSSYSELISQAQALMQQAEQVRKQELSNVIADIKAKMAEYGITIEDLGGSTRKGASSKSKAKAPAKYRGPNGELWSGGPGRKPDWVKAALAAGNDIESFRI
jgi:DNA-binding protein H-NS